MAVAAEDRLLRQRLLQVATPCRSRRSADQPPAQRRRARADQQPPDAPELAASPPGGGDAARRGRSREVPRAAAGPPPKAVPALSAEAIETILGFISTPLGVARLSRHGCRQLSTSPTGSAWPVLSIVSAAQVA
mmetsp:Transcript_3099/g.6227  ORF Transcript_3099/g.6227 Transcript_3099/m.6227 type:complete len:134 (+) Transcript_3099:83-484(+)